jgi:hypothetical protein
MEYAEIRALDFGFGLAINVPQRACNRDESSMRESA